MDKESIIAKILSLPENLHKLGNISISGLLKDSGYLEISSSIYYQDILMGLRKSPQLAQEWLIYSENQRSNNAWYLRQTDCGWEVNYVPSNGNENLYPTFLEACAAYIILEIENIAKFL